VCAVVTLVVSDLLQRREPVRRIYPVIGRIPPLLRSLAELVRLDMSRDGPFTHEQLLEIRSRALTGISKSSFGTRLDPAASDNMTIAVSVLPAPEARVEPVEIGGSIGRRGLFVPVLNFGALGYGPVNERVIETFGIAAREVGCLQDTGEDGLTRFHLDGGASLLWQVSTGYWGCRDEVGRFSPDAFREAATHPAIAAIELKLSQGAKPGAGGLLPASKNTPKVADILGVMPNTDIVSPQRHTAFNELADMLRFLTRLSDLSDGRPVGIKLCIGSAVAAGELVAAMSATRIVPDFISIDGGEGGTGASASVLQDHAGLSVRAAVPLLGAALETAGLRERTRIFASGRVHDGFDVVELLALGADACFAVRAPLVAIGCVQARTCHSGHCPSGLATHNPWRMRGIVPSVQGPALARYHSTVMQDVQALLTASGLSSSSMLGPDMLERFGP
jgi:glutamate synthase domain-containing protein 2